MKKISTPHIINAISDMAHTYSIINALDSGFDLYLSGEPLLYCIYLTAKIYFSLELVSHVVIYSVEFVILPQLYEIIATLAALKKIKVATYNVASTSNTNPKNIRRCRDTKFCRKIPNFVTWIKRQTTQIYNNGNQK